MEKLIRILSAQDCSCYGQCSLTVALPILSSLGIETAILPTAILSTHTSGFSGFTFRDLSEDLPRIASHWGKEGIVFDAVYTGYLGTIGDVEAVKSIALGKRNRGAFIVDPAFGDHGVLYGGFDLTYVEAMKRICFSSDYLLPNLTEAAFLLGREFVGSVDRNSAKEILHALRDLGAKTIVLKGVAEHEGKTGFALLEGDEVSFYEHDRFDEDFHGTGDVFASVFVGGIMRGLSSFEAGKLAADFVRRCIEFTAQGEGHRYGVRFEPLLLELGGALEKLLA